MISTKGFGSTHSQRNVCFQIHIYSEHNRGNMQKNLFLVIGFVLISTIILAQGKSASNPVASFPAASQFANTQFSHKIIPAVNNTYSYDMLADGKILIHQPSIPGLPGNEGFKTKQDAEKVAKLIISKIKKGEMPPSVTIDELKKLKVL